MAAVRFFCAEKLIFDSSWKKATATYNAIYRADQTQKCLPTMNQSGAVFCFSHRIQYWRQQPQHNDFDFSLFLVNVSFSNGFWPIWTLALSAYKETRVDDHSWLGILNVQKHLAQFKAHSVATMFRRVQQMLVHIIYFDCRHLKTHFPII